MEKFWHTLSLAMTCALLVSVQSAFADIAPDVSPVETAARLIVPALALACGVGLGIAWLNKRKTKTSPAALPLLIFSLTSFAVSAASIAIPSILDSEREKQRSIDRMNAYEARQQRSRSMTEAEIKQSQDDLAEERKQH